MFRSRAFYHPLSRAMLSSLPFLIAALLTGCAIGDSEQVDCRCAPETNVQLFPHCDGVVEERPDSKTPLSTQIPDCPSGQQLTLLQPTRPEYVLANIISILEAQSEKRSAQQYMEQFTDDFVFSPDPEDEQLYPEIYGTGRDTLWGAAEELNFARILLSPERLHSADFIRWFKSSLDEKIIDDNQLRETFIFPYEAEFVEIISAAGADSEETTFNPIGIKGLVEIDLVTPTVENPVWAIAAWRDRRDQASAKFSWGELRARFSQ